MSTQAKSSDVEMIPRVARLETNYDNLKDELHGVKEELHGQGVKIDKVLSALHGFSRTPWMTMGTWAGAVVVVISLLLAPVFKEISRNTSDIQQVHENEIALAVQAERLRWIMKHVDEDEPDAHSEH